MQIVDIKSRRHDAQPNKIRRLLTYYCNEADLENWRWLKSFGLFAGKSRGERSGVYVLNSLLDNSVGKSNLECSISDWRVKCFMRNWYLSSLPNEKCDTNADAASHADDQEKCATSRKQCRRTDAHLRDMYNYWHKMYNSYEIEP